MKLTVKTLKGSKFVVQVQPNDTVMSVKKTIEDAQGKDSYPCGQQLLIHSGKVLKDETTLEENNVAEDGFLVVMLSKTNAPVTAGTSSAQPSTTPPASIPTSMHEASPQALAPENTVTVTDIAAAEVPSDVYGDTASYLVAGVNLEQTIQQIIDMGGGSWDRDTILRALRAAYNNPEQAVEYLYSGIPEEAEVAIPPASVPSNQVTGQQTNTTSEAGVAPLSGLPNSSPLNMFPQGNPNPGSGRGAGSLEFLRNNQQFQALRTMVQANPQILQPMLRELSKQNPQLLRLIQEHHAEFLQLINEPLEGAEGDLFEQAEQDMPHSISVTPAEQEAIERLEAMGFDRALVIEAFLACDRNEELAVNYLLENAGDYEDQ